MQRALRSRFEAHWIALLRDLRGTGNVPLTEAQLELLRREFLLALDRVWDAALFRSRRLAGLAPGAGRPLGRPARGVSLDRRGPLASQPARRPPPAH
jgi:hypothetical protein